MVTSSIFSYLKNKNFKLKVEKKNNPFKFYYKDNKFSLCIKNISFAYRTNLDEYRVQIGEKFREQLKGYHLQGYWALIIGYHQKSNTYAAWDNKLSSSLKDSLEMHLVHLLIQFQFPDLWTRSEESEIEIKNSKW